MEQTLQKLNQHDRMSLWTERVAECRSSGMSVRQWCRTNGIAEKTYYYWQRRVFNAAKAAAEPVFAEVVVPEGHSAGVAAVVCTASFRIEIQNGADSVTLRTIFSALSSC